MSKHRAVHGPIFPEDPTTSDDCLSGFGVGFRWFNSVSKSFWFCEGAAPNAASWIKIALANAGGAVGNKLTLGGNYLTLAGNSLTLG